MVNQPNDINPLVSVVMPAYKAAYLKEALQSLQDQTYRPLELVICDDCRTDEVRAVVDEYRGILDFPVHYSYNETRLHESKNLAKCVSLASGEYLKFLYDDDVLHPECVERMVDAMRERPGIELVSSRRRRIDDQGRQLPDILATALPFVEDALVDGIGLTSFLAEHTVNFIGEPSTVLCRREAVAAFGDQVMALNGVPIRWVGDLALYVKLLQKGDLAFLSTPLVDFRVSREQFSQLGRDKPGIGDKGHQDFRQAVRDLGWYIEGGDQLVGVSPLHREQVPERVDLLAALRQAHALSEMTERFDEWLAARKPSPIQKRLIDEHLRANGLGVHVEVLLPAGEDAAALQATLDSLAVAAQLYPNVSVTLLGAQTQAVDSGLRLRHQPVGNDGMACAINEALRSSTADWAVLAGAGDLFTASGLMVAGLELMGAGGCRAVSTDLVLRGEDGREGPAMRPDFNLDLLISFPTSLAHHCLFNREAILQIGGFDGEYPQALELDLLLRLVEQGGLDGLAHLSEPLLSTAAPSLQANPDEERTLQRHLAARGYGQARVQSHLPGRYHIDYGHAAQPPVSILIVLRDQLAAVQRCVMSLLEHTAYPNYEILLVDNASENPATRQWLEGVEQMAAERVRVLRSGEPLADAHLKNLAAAHARGDYLLLLRPETAVFQGEWLGELVNQAQRPEVGVVGARTIDGDGRITHAGLVLGLRGVAGHAFIGEDMNATGYMNRLQVAQNYSAVSDGCLMIRKALFDELGGLDEGDFAERGADVDLCLRAGEAGYLVSWTPHATLLHSQVPEAEPVELQDAFYARWLPRLARDPAYNPNFSLVRARGGFVLTDTQLTFRPLAWQPLPTVLAHFADTFGCGHYRVIQPFLAQREQGLIEGVVTHGLLHVADLERFSPDVVLLQRQIGDERLDAMRRMKAFSRAFKVYELDDYLPNLPLKNQHREHMPKDILRSLRRGLGYVDRFVVSTEALAEAFSDLHPDIRVAYNRLAPGWWGGLQPSQRRRSAKPRVGWAGGVSHTGDLELIADVVKELANEVEWVFFGMCPERIRPYVHEFHPGLPIQQYPAKLASLDLDLALAPLEDNLFNQCKSNLRLLEYGACGFPVVCSDNRAYAGDLPATRVKNRFRDWVEAIRMHLADLDATARMGDELRDRVRAEWMLQGDNLQAWHRAWQPD
ncbi:glycosyltransferase [Pseudomonas citronellolis]|uniref:glycosyltransferase n=1 Tax=Pseudomonas citronellolis TaxID=53408 RepID=UPI0022BA123C|nr:glycosyltransferase [Pseudomonas citronellolis]WBG63087.1 glycosyltransferase [Pseudomonas citronellolis]